MLANIKSIGQTPTPPWQKLCNSLGKTGCLFLVLSEIGRRVLGRYPANISGPLLDDFKTALDKGWVDSECYVAQPTLYMSHITGGRTWEYIKTKDLSDAKIGDWIIGCYLERTTLSEKYHFVLLDAKGVLEWDPYGTSQTVANGKIHSYRILRMS